jgi:hypothetical protein
VLSGLLDCRANPCWVEVMAIAEEPDLGRDFEVFEQVSRDCTEYAVGLEVGVVVGRVQSPHADSECRFEQLTVGTRSV